jgi:hypothetical protein
MAELDIAKLQRSLEETGKHIPKVVSPAMHAIADYATAAGFAIAGALFWKRSKRAALASFLFGAAEASLACLTDYPGGLKKLISLPLHVKLDFSVAGTVAAVPEFLALHEPLERDFFRVQSIAIGGIAAATQVEPQQIAEQEQKAA